MNITILGYYGHGNYGDDLFEVLFKKIYSGNNLNFYEPNKITYIPDSTDIIICGGGDIINDWFMEQIAKLKIRAEQKAGKKIPTYAISIGVTFKNSIPNDKPYYLDVFDYWIVRNKIDVNLLKKRYSEENIIYVPDVVHLLAHYKPKKISKFFNSWVGLGSGVLRPVVGIFLTNTISNRGTNSKYDEEVEGFVKLITSIPTNYIIHLVPFNVGKNKCENDSILNEQIYKKLSSTQKERVQVKNFTLKELVESFRSSVYSYGIAMRYHSHILCQTYSVPFISISMTNKTYEYMRDFGIQQYMIDYTDREINTEDFVKLFEKLVLDKNFFKRQTESRVLNVEKFLFPIKNKIIRKSGPEYFLIEDFVKLFNGVIEKLIKTLFKNMDLIEITKVFVNKYCLQDVYTNFKIENPNEEIRKFITSFIIYEITGLVNTEYNYGLEQKIVECNLYENILWIHQNRFFKAQGSNFSQTLPQQQPPLSISIDFLQFTFENKQIPKLNFGYIDNSFSPGTHRSGWEYAGSALINKFNCSQSKTIVDLYVDKTFLWSSSIYETNKKIPYTNPWIGFIHHTPNPEYTPNSLNSILASPSFIKSLRFCKGIIVLSNYLKKYLDTHFKFKVPVYVLSHPTETPNIKFNWDDFESNHLKQIIQIGGWLRNSYAIYELAINEKKLKITKALIQGKSMANYVKPLDLDITELRKYMYKNPPELNTRMCSVSTNKYVEGLVESISRAYSSVQVIPQLSNKEYDLLLSKNIVFINLINASACNTLIECVVRNTPILINRLEAVEEVLGSEYPFFYDTIQEASYMATDLSLIKKTYEYLSKMDKTKLSINAFVKDFENIVTNL